MQFHKEEVVFSNDGFNLSRFRLLHLYSARDFYGYVLDGRSKTQIVNITNRNNYESKKCQHVSLKWYPAAIATKDFVTMGRIYILEKDA